VAQYFDNWYADMAASPVKDEIHQRHLGLPPGLLSNSSLTCEGIAEVTETLHLSPGATLLDLACGRGGYGLEIAARTDARLVGVDFSAEY
jgi:2-polyprenyl-3-methyl-5-hydroxy-6-metoxy-1,4-benzoquinol methylase